MFLDDYPAMEILCHDSTEMNPYSPPDPNTARTQAVPRYRILAAALLVFAAYMSVTELVPQLIQAFRMHRIQNPIGFLLGITILGVVVRVTLLEWSGKTPKSSTAFLLCFVLISITLLVTVRFAMVFLPQLSIHNFQQHRNVLFGQAFCLIVWIYSANVVLRHRLMRRQAAGKHTVPTSGGLH